MNNFHAILTIFGASAKEGCVETALLGTVCDNCNGSGTMRVLALSVRIMTYGVGILAVIGILTFGIKYLTSRGDENLAIKARRHLFEVLIGIGAYVVSITGLSWLLPGNLTMTMLGGDDTCPIKTETVISVEGQNNGDEEDDTKLKPGWKKGERPRECGPGEPGDFQTYNKEGLTTEKGVFPIYTNSVGRTFAQYNQGDPLWANDKLHSSCTADCSTIGGAGCCFTSYAMISESYTSRLDNHYYPATNQEYDRSGHTDRKGGFHCVGGGECDFDRIKNTIDAGGVVLVHACGHWGGKEYYSTCVKNQSYSTHWFLLVDYRIKDGEREYYFLNTNYSDIDSFSGKGGTGWGLFGGSGIEYYDLHFRYPAENWDCKVRNT